MKAKAFDKRFDQGEDISKCLEMSAARRPNQAIRRVNVDSPVWMIEPLDRESKRMGVPRQLIIKVWIPERLESERR